MRIMKILELNPRYFPGYQGDLSASLICADALITCVTLNGGGFMVAVPTRRNATSQKVPHALAQLLLWAREAHSADWLWFEPTNPDTDPELEALLS